MNPGTVYTAAALLLDRIQALHRTVETVLPQIEDALRQQADGLTRQASALSHFGALPRPTHDFLTALGKLQSVLRGQPPTPPPPPPAPPAPGIDFRRFKKLCEPLVLEKTVEILAPLPGEKHQVPLRLEAMKQPRGSGYDVAIYWQESVTLQPDSITPRPPPISARIWHAYETIHSDRPTADQALEQVLSFLDGRCI